MNDPDNTEVIVYTSGLVHCSCCAPATMPLEDVLASVNLQNPTGISSQWKLAETKHFIDGKPMPCQCDQNADRLHYL